MRGHQSGNDLRGGGIATVLPGIGNDGVGQAMLVVDGDDRKMTLVADVTGQWLEVGDDQVDFRAINHSVEAGQTFSGLRDGDEIFSDGALVTDPVVDIGEAE